MHNKKPKHGLLRKMNQRNLTFPGNLDKEKIVIDKRGLRTAETSPDQPQKSWPFQLIRGHFNEWRQPQSFGWNWNNDLQKKSFHGVELGWNRRNEAKRLERPTFSAVRSTRIPRSIRDEGHAHLYQPSASFHLPWTPQKRQQQKSPRSRYRDDHRSVATTTKSDVSIPNFAHVAARGGRSLIPTHSTDRQGLPVVL